MKVLIVGGIASGVNMAARIKKENSDADVTLLTRENNVLNCAGGYEGCIINDESNGNCAVSIMTGREIVKLDRDKKLLTAENMTDKKEEQYSYDKLVITTGATSVVSDSESSDSDGVYNYSKVKSADENVTPEDVARVKGLGFLFDKRTKDRFNCRVITRNGKITSAEHRAVANAAELFGSGEVAMTTRMTLEIQGVPYGNIEPLREFLMQSGLETGGTGPKVRPVVSCKGTTCQYGLIDTFSLSEEIHERFYHGYHDVKLPHKFKIAVGGCPNNCVKPDLNDLGIIGQKVPKINFDKCRGCKVCQIEKACPLGVPKVLDGKVFIDDGKCNHCGRCVTKCPFKALEEYTEGYRVYIGGRWGKKVARGKFLDKIFTDREEILNLVEKAILLFREQGAAGERFADTVERIGFERVQEQLFKDDLMDRKQEILSGK